MLVVLTELQIPGPIARPAVPMRTRPVAATVVVIDHGTGADVARVRSDAGGRALIEVPAGRYRVHGCDIDARSWPLCHDVIVDVAEAGDTEVTLRLDSGIR